MARWRIQWRVLALMGALLARAAAAPIDDGVARLRREIATRMVRKSTGILVTRTAHGDALEDTSLYGGFYLGALSLAWGETRDPETAALARRVFAGLLLNASMGEPGFVARGVAEDRTTFRGEPSADQYTGFLYGLWEFQRSGLATAAETRQIAEVWQAVLKRLQRDGWQILTNDRAKVTRYGKLAGIRPTRSERLLSFVLSGAVVTGERSWWPEYERLRIPRMKSLGPWERFESWVLIQTAASLRMLCVDEERPAVLRPYAETSHQIATNCLPQLAGWAAFGIDQRPISEALRDRTFALRAIRIPAEAVTTIFLLGDDEQAKRALPVLREMLARMPFEQCHDSRPLVALEWAYWLARRRGLLPASGER